MKRLLAVQVAALATSEFMSHLHGYAKVQRADGTEYLSTIIKRSDGTFWARTTASVAGNVQIELVSGELYREVVTPGA